MKKSIGIRAIQRALSECAFNPKNPGPLKIVFDVDDFDYYASRAREYILEIKSSNDKEFINDRLTKAIQLLIWVKIHNG